MRSRKSGVLEVYQALQTGVVDGCENTASNYLSQKFHEVQKHITISYHAHLQYAVIVNWKFWGGLPADIRNPLNKAMDEATDFTNSIASKENDDALAEIKKSGKTELHTLTPEQRKAWQARCSRPGNGRKAASARRSLRCCRSRHQAERWPGKI